MERARVNMRKSIIVANPFEIIRLSIALLLKKYGYQVKLAVNSLEELLEKMDSVSADVLLIHYSLYKPGDIIKQITDTTGGNVVLLGSSSSYSKNSYQMILDQISEGIIGFLDIDEPLGIFLRGLDSVSSGDMVVSKTFVKNLNQKSKIVTGQLESILSKREIQILNLLSTGSSNKKIGSELYLSEHTIKVHIRNILTKLNLKSRHQAIAYSIRQSLLAEQLKADNS